MLRVGGGGGRGGEGGQCNFGRGKVGQGEGEIM